MAMELAHESFSFSIREYVSRMRSVSLVKCWPFDEPTSEESVQSLLPPITVKKFIWWLDGLEYSHPSKNDDGPKKNKKIKLAEEEEEEGNGAVEANSSRSKAKPLKKRLISELFAVQEEEEEDGFYAHGSGLSCEDLVNWGIKGKRKKFLRHKFGNPNSSHTRKNENDIRDHVYIPKKKPRLQHVDADKKAVAPKRRIPKNSTKALCLTKTTKHKLHDNCDGTFRGGKVPIIMETSETEDVSNTLENEVDVGRASEEHRNEDEPLSDRTLDVDKQHLFDIGGVEKVSHFPPIFSCTPHDAYRNITAVMTSSYSTNSGDDKQNEDLGTFDPRFRHISPRQLQQAVCSGYINRKRSSNEINDDFVRLPLNSRGELITTSTSSSKANFNQNKLTSMTACPSIINTLSECFVKDSEIKSWDCTTTSRNPLNLFPVEGRLKESSIVYVPSRFDMTESRVNMNNNNNNNNNNNPVFSEKFLYKEDNLSTMRLMGKEFIVADRHIWKDKQIMPYSDEPSILPSDITNNQVIDSTYTFPHADRRTREDIISRNINPAEEIYPGFPRGSFRNRDSCPFARSSGNCMMKNQNLPSNHNVSLSAIRFPFAHPDLDPPVQSAWSGSPRDKGSLFFVESASEKNRNLAGMNRGIDSSVSTNHEGFGLYNYISFGSTLHGSPASGLSYEQQKLRLEKTRRTNRVRNWC